MLYDIGLVMVAIFIIAGLLLFLAAMVKAAYDAARERDFYLLSLFGALFWLVIASTLMILGASK